MMKWLNITLCACFISGLLYAQEAAKKAPIVSTTIDFLDYAFYDREGSQDYYELSVWEKRLQALASCGITKVYLRVNACGATLWPSKVSPQYGKDGRVHYNAKEQGMRLARTLQKYDALAETIRLGHKHGLEVWCWDSSWDDSARPYGKVQYADDVAKHGTYPLMDNWHYDHPGNWSRRDPRLDPKDDLPTIDVKQHPISRVVLVSMRKDKKPCRVQRENMTIYVSEDGRKYTKYEKDFKAEATLNADGYPQLVITGLEIRSPYVKFYQDNNYKVDGFNMVFNSSSSQSSHIYDDSGREMAATWGQRIDREPTPADAPVEFDNFVQFAWDAGYYQLGVYAGSMKLAVDHTKWLVGIPELLIPAARAHKVDRFRELAAYKFDGFIYNIRSHSLGFAGDHLVGAYGFNPELVAEFKRRTGKDILKDEYDREAFDNMRSEGLDKFLAECKALTNGRPLYMTVGVPNTDKIKFGISGAANWLQAFGMRFHVDKWIADGSVDGITLLGNSVHAVPNEYVGKKVNGKPLKISIFREMAFPPEGKKYDFEKDINALVKTPNVDEIELYESLVLNEEKRMIITEALKKVK